MAIAIPQLLTQLGGGAGALSAFRLQPGWVAGADPSPWFWIKNLGWFAPLLIVGLVTRRLVSERARRFLIAFMFLFVAANVAVFQPWDWDNHKFLVYGSLRSPSSSRPCSRGSGGNERTSEADVLVAGVVLSMTASGILEDVGTLLGQSRFRMLEPAQVNWPTRSGRRPTPTLCS